MRWNTRMAAAAAALVAFLAAPAAALDLPGWNDPPAECPAWLKGDAPFFVELFYMAPAENDNAAPLYRQAFAAFEHVRERERLARTDRLWRILPELNGDPVSFDRELADGLLEDQADCFRKLAAARERPECVFMGDGKEATDHARFITMTLKVRVFRDVERGDLDRAIDGVAASLRLSRDLRPRGRFYSQVAGGAMDNDACAQIARTILGSPLLGVDHCDRLMALLREHEATGLDRLLTGAKAEYVVQRVELRAFQHKRLLQDVADGRSEDVELSADDLAQRFLRLADKEAAFAPTDAIQANAEWMKRGAAAVRQHGPLWKQERLAFDAVYQAVATAADLPYPERIRVLRDAHAKWLGDKEHPSPLWLARALLTTMFSTDDESYSIVARALARSDAYLRLQQCLLALRRWGLTHADAVIPDLAEACRAAGLPGTPIDPFSGKPLKLATVDGRAVVYSIGPDGVDDQGRKDIRSNHDWEGDIMFPAPDLVPWPPLNNN